MKQRANSRAVEATPGGGGASLMPAGRRKRELAQAASISAQQSRKPTKRDQSAPPASPTEREESEVLETVGVEDADTPDAVAELEAVVGAEVEDEEPAEKRESEEPSNFLAMYFKEMARLAVLRPQEEFESARKIEALEIALWAHILSFAPIVDHVLQVCECTLENSVAEFKTLRKHA